MTTTRVRRYLLAVVFCLFLLILFCYIQTSWKQPWSPKSVESDETGDEGSISEDEGSISTSMSFLDPTDPDPNVDCEVLCQPMMDALSQASLSKARHLALQVQQLYPQCQSVIAGTYSKHLDALLALQPLTNTLNKIAKLAQRDDDIKLISPPSCWNPAHALDGMDLDLEEASEIVMAKWDLCCSQISSSTTKRGEDECYQLDKTLQRKPLCCGFYKGSLSHLKLPVLQELSIQLLLPRFDLLLQQEGFLRKFDAAGVLWPTGYMLALCLSDPMDCGIPELFEALDHHTNSDLVAVELGAGIGAPSLSLSKFLMSRDTRMRVVATDKAAHALAMIVLNSKSSRVPVQVEHIQDHSNLTALQEFKDDTLFGSDGFAVVLGSSLQSLFDFKTRDPRHQLWQVLDQLLDYKNNPRAIAILAHVVGAVAPPSAGPWVLIQSISGNHFDMKTRSGDDSDFQISLYGRKDNGAQEGEL